MKNLPLSTKNIFHSSIIMLCLSGCGKQPSYQLTPLEPRMHYDQMTKATETGDVTMRCRICTKQYMREVLGKQADVLLGRSYKRIVPLHITIENNSSYAWSLSPYDVHLPVADMQLVASRFVKSAAPQGLVSLGAHIALGVACISLGTAASILHPMLGASIFGAGCSMIIMAPMFSHHKAAAVGEQNARYETVLNTIALTDNVIIHPHEQINKLIFVEHKNLVHNTFKVRLCNAHDNDHTMLYTLHLDTLTT